MKYTVQLQNLLAFFLELVKENLPLIIISLMNIQTSIFRCAFKWNNENIIEIQDSLICLHLGHVENRLQFQDHSVT